MLPNSPKAPEMLTHCAGFPSELVSLSEMEEALRKYECLLFDMDDTLYPLSSGISEACRKNIQEYMQHHLHIEETVVPTMCYELYKKYGTTMAGLKVIGYEFDNDEFHAYVHGRLPYDLLKPDPIFTNADKVHVAQVLSRLQLEDCFDGVICFETLNPPVPAKFMDSVNEGKINGEDSTFKNEILCKPSIQAFEAAISIAGIDPKKTIFFDDSIRNVGSAKAVGLHTVIVGRSTLLPGADLALNSMHNIREALPEIWENEEEYLEKMIQSSVIGTVVQA